MKNYFYLLSAYLLLSFVFFISPIAANAATYVDQRTSSSLNFYTAINDGSALMNMGLPSTANTTTSLVLEFASFTDTNGTNLGGCNFQVLSLNSLSAGSPQNAIVGTSVDFISSSTITIATTTATLWVYGMHFTSAVETTRYYMNGTYNCANTSPFLSRYPHSSDGYTQNVDTTKVPNGFTWGALCDLSSYSSSTGCAPAVPPAGVSFGFPNDGITTPDFSKWTLIPTGLPPDGTFSVSYGTTSTTLNLTDQLSISGYPSDNSPFVFKKNNLLWIPSYPIPSVWYAEGIYTAATSSYFTNIISFNVDPTTSTPSTTYSVYSSPFIGGSSNVSTTFPSLGSSTQCSFSASNASSSALVQFFDPLDLRSTFEVAICNSFVFLFVPTADQQKDMTSGFQGIASSVSNKPPIGYFTLAAADLSGLSTSTATTSLITSSTRNAFSVIFSPVDIGLGAIIGLLALLWAFHRIRHFDFHQ